MRISFWESEKGNLVSHHAGITDEQVKEFQELKIGDKFILYKNERDNRNSPHYTMRIFKPKDGTEKVR